MKSSHTSLHLTGRESFRLVPEGGNHVALYMHSGGDNLGLILGDDNGAELNAKVLRGIAEQAASLAVLVERRQARIDQDAAMATYPESVA